MAHADNAAPAPRAGDITLAQLVGAVEALDTLSDSRLDGATAVKLVRLQSWATPHYLRHNEIHMKACDKLGEKLSEGKYRIPSTKRPEFDRVMAPVNAEVVDLDPQLKIHIDELKEVKISIRALAALAPFLIGM